MIESGVVTATDVDGAISLCDDPSLSFMSQIVVAAWGHASSRSLEGPRFAAVTENARTLSRQLENHNRSYDRLETRDLADRLLAGDGA